MVAPLLWAFTIVLCGSLRPEYSHFAQYISELGERGSSTELAMRYLGFVPTGLLHIGFAAFLYAAFRGSRLAAIAAMLLAINGFARIGAGLFPCEPGCAGPKVLLSQQLHSLSAAVGFFAFIGTSVLWGIVLRRYPSLRGLSPYSVASGILGLAFLLLMVWSDPQRAGTGLYERLSSGVLSLWVLVFAARLWQLGRETGTVQEADFTQTLQQAIDESRAAGLDAAVRELEQAAGAAYTTSSEYLGEIGAAIARFLQLNGRHLPPATAAKFHRCLVEVGKVWPKYRP
ncbi:MAG TPA: DUF998 domain-containing protein [Burkholderiales bacterium]|jgi:hypothetical membrane protein|nr:DUF998 domain-containing protein [Burkholderiales bacterium]